MRKQVLIIVLKYGLGLGLLAWVVGSHWSRTLDKKEVGIAGVLERPWHGQFLLAAACLCVSGVLLTFVRWFLLVRAQGLPFQLTNALRLGMVGYFFSIFLPGSVGGDIVKAACIAREQSRRTVAVATVLVDRAVGLCGLFWLAALLGSCFWATGMLEETITSAEVLVLVKTIVSFEVAVVAASLTFWFVLGLISDERSVRMASLLERMPKIGHAVAELWRAVRLYRSRGRVIGLTLGMSMISHAGYVLTFYCAARTLLGAAEVPSLAAHYLIIPVGMTFKGFFPSPGGVGGGEYAFGELYRLLHFSSAGGVLASLTQRAIEWSWGLIGYLVYLQMRGEGGGMRVEAREFDGHALRVAEKDNASVRI